jgi:predicted dehydrogenase
MDPATWYSGLRLWIERGNTIDQRDLPVVDHFTTEMDHMSDCVMQNKEPLTPGEEGLRDLTIMMAIYEAAKSGRTVKL